MRLEKIFNQDDGSKIKIVCHFSVGYTEIKPTFEIQSIWECLKGKRKFHLLRDIPGSQKKYATECEQVKKEMWLKLRPTSGDEQKIAVETFCPGHKGFYEATGTSYREVKCEECSRVLIRYFNSESKKVGVV